MGRPHPWPPSTRLTSVSHLCVPCGHTNQVVATPVFAIIGPFSLFVGGFKTCLKVTSHIVLEATLFQYSIILTRPYSKRGPSQLQEARKLGDAIQ